MKSFIRSKFIGGFEYKYLITPYYDKKSKKVKQRSKYIGKVIGDKVVKVRQKQPKMVLNYGEILPLLSILKKYKIKEFLVRAFGEEASKQIIALVMCKTLTHLSLRDVEKWYESSYLSVDYGDISLSSQTLSYLLAKIGQSQPQEQLLGHLLKSLSSKRTFFYDITSISSYSELITMLEWGYNRDSLSLPQVNLSVIVDKDEGIPIYYQLYPGSISDVKTITNILKKLKIQHIESYTLILDRGFFSNSNIKDIKQTKADFIIAIPERYNKITELLLDLTKKIEQTGNAKLYEGELIFTKKITIDTGEIKMKGHVYYNSGRAQKEKENFYKRLITAKQSMESLKSGRRNEETIREKAGNLISYFEIDKNGNTIDVIIKEELVKKHLKTKGLFLIGYKGEYKWDECLLLYKNKQMIEMAFDILKNDLEITTPYVHSNESLKGILFIGILSLMLRMRILKVLKETGKNKEYSYDRVILELQKLKGIIYPEKEIIYNEITKKQQELLKIFNAVPN